MQIRSGPSQLAEGWALQCRFGHRSDACEDDAVSFYDEVGGHPTFAAQCTTSTRGRE